MSGIVRALVWTDYVPEVGFAEAIRLRNANRLHGTSCVQELILINSGCSEDRAKSALGDITWVIGNSGSRTSRLLPPNLVASLGLTVESEAELLQLPHTSTYLNPASLPICQGMLIGISNPILAGFTTWSFGGSGSPCSTYDSTSLRATSWAISVHSAIVRP